MATEKRLISVCDATSVYNGIALYMAENAYLNDSALDVLKMVAKWLNECPTVDAVEVVHGRWKPVYTCSGERLWGYNCNRCKLDSPTQSKYCPNCGAKMDGDRNG